MQTSHDIGKKMSFLTLEMNGGNISWREQEGDRSPTVVATVLGTISGENNMDWQQFLEQL